MCGHCETHFLPETQLQRYLRQATQVPRPPAWPDSHAHLRFIICVPFLFVDGQNQHTHSHTTPCTHKNKHTHTHSYSYNKAQYKNGVFSFQLEFKLKCECSEGKLQSSRPTINKFTYSSLHEYIRYA